MSSVNRIEARPIREGRQESTWRGLVDDRYLSIFQLMRLLCQKLADMVSQYGETFYIYRLPISSGTGVKAEAVTQRFFHAETGKQV